MYLCVICHSYQSDKQSQSLFLFLLFNFSLRPNHCLIPIMMLSSSRVLVCVFQFFEYAYVSKGGLLARSTGVTYAFPAHCLK